MKGMPTWPQRAYLLQHVPIPIAEQHEAELLRRGEERVKRDTAMRWERRVEDLEFLTTEAQFVEDDLSPARYRLMRVGMFYQPLGLEPSLAIWMGQREAATSPEGFAAASGATAATGSEMGGDNDGTNQ
jgi:hypothetical protein